MQRWAEICARELETPWFAMELALRVEEPMGVPFERVIHAPAQAGKRARSGLQSAL